MSDKCKKYYNNRIKEGYNGDIYMTFKLMAMVE